MAINKVIYGTSTLIDLTADTVATDTLGKDTTAHDKSGTGITGTLEGGGSGGGGSETWVLNSSIPVNNDTNDITWDVEFVSYNKNYSTLSWASSTVAPLRYDDTIVYGGRPISNWKAEVYRKITFSTPPIGDLLTWLKANAVKQAADTAVQESKSVSITENGTATVSPDVPYDAIKSVEVTTNVASSGTVTKTTTVTIRRGNFIDGEGDEHLTVYSGITGEPLECLSTSVSTCVIKDVPIGSILCFLTNMNTKMWDNYLNNDILPVNPESSLLGNVVGVGMNNDNVVFSVVVVEGLAVGGEY